MQIQPREAINSKPDHGEEAEGGEGGVERIFFIIIKGGFNLNAIFPPLDMAF